MLPIALNELTQSDPEFRESLPIDFLNYTGIALQDVSQQYCATLALWLTLHVDVAMTYWIHV